MRSYHVKENPIGSEVSEILLYKQTNILFLYFNNWLNKNYNIETAQAAAAAAAPAEDSYGSPQADPVAASQAADDYGAPRGPPVGAGSGFREQKELPAQGIYLLITNGCAPSTIY